MLFLQMAIEGNSEGLLSHELLQSSLNTVDANKNSILHYAVRNSHTEIVEKLFEEFEDIQVDICGWERMTPLHHASR